MKLKYEDGYEIGEAADMAGLPPIRFDQLRAVAKRTIGISDLDAIFEKCRQEHICFTWFPLVEIGGEGRRYDQWLYNLKSTEDDDLLADCGTIFFGDTTDETGAVMIQLGWTVITKDPEAAEIVEAIETMFR